MTATNETAGFYRGFAIQTQWSGEADRLLSCRSLNLRGYASWEALRAAIDAALAAEADAFARVARDRR